jgi:excisionase family DNA binding protein
LKKAEKRHKKSHLIGIKEMIFTVSRGPWKKTFPAQDAAPEILTTVEVANLLRITPEGVCNMAKRRELPAAKLGKVWRYRRSDIMDYLDKKIMEGESA